MKDLNRLLEMQRMYERHVDEVGRIGQPFHYRARRMAEQQEQIRRSLLPLTLTPQWIEQIKTMLDSYEHARRLMPTLLVDTRNLQQALERLRLHTSLAPAALRQLQLPAAIWDTSIRRMLRDFDSTRLSELYPNLSSNLVRPFSYFSDYTTRTLNAMDETDDDDAAHVLSAALVLAQEHTLLAADSLELGVRLEGEDVDILDTGAITVFEAQESELALAPRRIELGDYDELLVLSPTAQLAKKVRDLVNSVTACNRAARLSGREEIFTPTTTFVQSIIDVMWVSVSDQTSFGVVVDAVYMMLYEGAGKDHLRFGTLVTDEESEIIWSIKRLRNKWLRHDPDHGSGGSQGKSWSDLRSTLQELGFSRLPRSTDDYRSIAHVLVGRSREFVELITTRIESSESDPL